MTTPKIKIDSTLLKEVEKYAEEYFIPVASAVNFLIKKGLENSYSEDAKKVGILEKKERLDREKAFRLSEKKARNEHLKAEYAKSGGAAADMGSKKLGEFIESVKPSDRWLFQYEISSWKKKAIEVDKKIAAEKAIDLVDSLKVTALEGTDAMKKAWLLIRPDIRKELMIYRKDLFYIAMVSDDDLKIIGRRPSDADKVLGRRHNKN